MALLWIDNFQQYGSRANMLNGAYAEAGGSPTAAIVADPDPTASGTVLELPATSAFPANARKVLASSTLTVGMAQRVWLNSLPASSSSGQVPAFRAHDGSNLCVCSIRVESDGSISAFRGIPFNGTVGGETGVLLGRSNPAIVATAWQHLEVKFVIHASAGSIEIRVDTVPVLNISGLNTGSAACTQVEIRNGLYPNGGNVDCYIKDFAVWDGTGTLNGNFVGNCFVAALRPDGDVSGGWSISGGAGSAWASINETNPDDDTKYIYSPWPAAAPDVFTLTDLPADATGVRGAMTLIRSRKSDGGDGNLQASLVSGSSTGSGTNRPVTPAYTYWSDMFETDPATGVAWSIAAINAARLKLDRTL